MTEQFKQKREFLKSLKPCNINGAIVTEAELRRIEWYLLELEEKKSPKKSISIEQES